MEELNERRKKEGEAERQSIGLVTKFLEKQRERFDYADTAHFILQNKNEMDLIFVSEKLGEWHTKAKEGNKKVFLEMIMTLFRIQSYCTTMETISKGSVAEYVREVKRVSYLEGEINLMKLQHRKEIQSIKQELENAKKEIEFITKQ